MTKMPLTIDLPPGVWGAVERLARESGVTPEQFLASAAAEKVGALTDAKAYFEKRAARAVCNGSTHSWREKPHRPQTRTTLTPAAAETPLSQAWNSLFAGPGRRGPFSKATNLTAFSAPSRTSRSSRASRDP